MARIRGKQTLANGLGSRAGGQHIIDNQHALSGKRGAMPGKSAGQIVTPGLRMQQFLHARVSHTHEVMHAERALQALRHHTSQQQRLVIATLLQTPWMNRHGHNEIR